MFFDVFNSCVKHKFKLLGRWEMGHYKAYGFKCVRCRHYGMVDIKVMRAALLTGGKMIVVA